jgi:hypothetical protein
MAITKPEDLDKQNKKAYLALKKKPPGPIRAIKTWVFVGDLSADQRAWWAEHDTQGVGWKGTIAYVHADEAVVTGARERSELEISLKRIGITKVTYANAAEPEVVDPAG